MQHDPDHIAREAEALTKVVNCRLAASSIMSGHPAAERLVAEVAADVLGDGWDYLPVQAYGGPPQIVVTSLR